MGERIVIVLGVAAVLACQPSLADVERRVAGLGSDVGAYAPVELAAARERLLAARTTTGAEQSRILDEATTFLDQATRRAETLRVTAQGRAAELQQAHGAERARAAEQVAHAAGERRTPLRTEPQPTDVTEVDARAVSQRLHAGERLLLVDVRSPAAFDSGHAVGAVRMPPDALRLQPPPTATEIVLMADERTRSLLPDAVAALRAGPSRTVVVVRGGLEAWLAAGLPWTAVATSPPGQRPSEVVAAGELRRLLDEKPGRVSLVDIRPVELFRQAHIPSAVSIPMAELPDVPLPPAEVLVIYGADDESAELAAARVNAEPGTKVMRLHAGFRGWAQAGHRVQSGAGRAPVVLGGVP